MTSTSHTDSGSPSTSSPTTTMASTSEAAAVENSLDDIFGSSPPPETRREPLQDQTATVPEPSDLPSLRRQHVTAGYRDGVAMSKGEHVQTGFDGGYPVGARLGMRAGTILGILEGIVRGFEDRGAAGVVKKPVAGRSTAGTSSTPEEVESAAARRRTKEQVLRLYQDAMKSLDVQAVFTGFDASTGSTQAETTPVPGEKAQVKKDPAETQLGAKGDAVVSRWEERVAVPRWEEIMETLETSESQGDKGAAGERS
ncbi:Essential protein Yae1 N-terminal [Penicillium capsulatum]|uniref:Protein YAE1 n=1 Tax=Penicillium capsulatum TaxID=69766 RepID=A0A9W9I2L4_9EURO|nr:Essential protein Yae1 N-terminal [Penicillium capsulatum]KAJ6117457.1 Essential protein Yae1 N-terminal [Penicillium capsulatum]